MIASLAKAKTARGARSVLCVFLVNSPQSVQEALGVVPIARLCEAITHLTKEELDRTKTVLFEILLAVFVDKFAAIDSLTKTFYRKAVSFCDEKLFAENGI